MSTDVRRSAIVVGGGSGIGRAAAQALAARGFDLTLLGRREAPLIETAQTVGHTRTRTVAFDVAAGNGYDEAVSEHVAAFGGLDALVVSSGIYRSVAATELGTDVWRDVIATNLTGTFEIARAALGPMLTAGVGRIVLVGSVIAGQSEVGSAAYSASKAAVHSLARSFAVEYGERGVSTNIVAPGWVATDMALDDIAALGPDGMRRVNPMARAAAPEEIANVVTYLAADAPSFLNGSTITVDGGQSVVAPSP